MFHSLLFIAASSLLISSSGAEFYGIVKMVIVGVHVENINNQGILNLENGYPLVKVAGSDRTMQLSQNYLAHLWTVCFQFSTLDCFDFVVITRFNSISNFGKPVVAALLVKLILDEDLKNAVKEVSFSPSQLKFTKEDNHCITVTIPETGPSYVSSDERCMNLYQSYYQKFSIQQSVVQVTELCVKDSSILTVDTCINWILQISGETLDEEELIQQLKCAVALRDNCKATVRVTYSLFQGEVNVYFTTFGAQIKGSKDLVKKFMERNTIYI